MLTIAIPQLYCGASGKKGAYNRQEVGLARALAAQGCRTVVLYPAVGAQDIETEEPAPGVKILYVPASAWRVHAFYSTWQPLLDEKVDAVHVMGDNSLGVPGLYRFCQEHGIFFYSQLGAVRSDARNPLVRAVMDLLCRRNLAIYRKTPTYAKTLAVQNTLEEMGVPCAGVLPVGLDTAIIPQVQGTKPELRAQLGLDPDAQILLFVGRLDTYKRPLDLVPLLAALPENWQAVVIGSGALAETLKGEMQAAGLDHRWVHIPSVPNTQVHAYYHACDVFVNFNDHEIFGMSLLEAMYAGCVPVARHAPGPDQIIEDGISGLLLDGGAEVFAAGVQAAACSAAMGQAARQRIREHFLWDNSARTVLAMLQQEGVHRDGQ
ncbi:glycosyltransferase family 4 protein [uncultured Gemmiger sp.]|uniref:glycosyltransferase family 4 protein n=1 Tax=uncultured Gemmiger sp. TaxID=1623490 RepID=UPI0025CBD5DD|nr:glycosyltransferase family 4 protein [uncultured Gemmiger sp.]